MWNDEDEFGDTPIEEKIMRAALPVPTTQTLGYHRNVDQLAEEDAVSKEERPLKKGLNRPMRVFPGTPEYWIANARKKHGTLTWYDTKGAIHVVEECHCVACMLKDYPSLTVGDPAPSQEHSPEELIEMGYVGLYHPPPPYSKPCPICGTMINLYMEVDSESEVVHVHCLSDGEREVLRNVGYSDPHMIRRKKDDADREVDDGPRHHECPECRCPGEGGEPVQGVGGEGGTVAEEGAEGEGPGQRSDQPGVDVHAEQAGEGAEAGSGQADAGEEAPDAEEDSG